MKYSFILVFMLVFASVFSQKSSNDVAIRYITKAMLEQEACWNKGDIPCFMEHYWHSDSLRFMGSKGVSYGWQKTLDNYIKSYPDKASMGKLNFNNEVMEFTDEHTVLVIGKWKLERSEDLKNLKGYYLLLWQQKNGVWVIVLDHSS